MSDYPDLEISLQRESPAAYRVSFRYSQPQSEADVRLAGGVAQLDVQAFSLIAPASPEYSQKLTTALFGDPQARQAFAQAVASAQTLDAPLRLRLLIDANAPELHSLHWERLNNPLDNTPLCTNQNLLFSRYLSSLDWRPVRLRRKEQLRALVVIANPANLGDYGMAAIDVGGELQRARQNLGEITVNTLAEEGAAQPATLQNTFARLAEAGAPAQNGYDILYLVCHGRLGRGEPTLWLEDNQGQAVPTPGAELVTRIKEMIERPRLVVLASCESAGEEAGAALSALGPRLAEAGVPAVLAMQGKISLETLSQFMPVFFRELERDGEIDRAAALARGAVRAQPDQWMPVLFMRLRHGRIWYTPGFSDERHEFEKLESLKSAIQMGACTPILGPALSDPLLGSQREIALRWADKHAYPLSPYDREDLPRVAQFVSVRQDPTYLRAAYRDAARDEVLRRFANLLPPELRQSARWTPEDLLKALELASDAYYQARSCNPYQEVARLRLTIYITTSPSDMLSNALRESGADPQVRLCPWNELIPKASCLYQDDPTAEKPLVYHLFGHIREPFSLVLTEDEYFDYLIGVTVNKDLIPTAVRAALTSTALLFLGFPLDDWSFRVFFRMVMAQEGRERLRLFSHAAVQVVPEEGRHIDSARARRYLEKYFESEKISLYWGSAEDFLCELKAYL